MPTQKSPKDAVAAEILNAGLLPINIHAATINPKIISN